MKKPNLFIVGMPKSGTTALHELLSQHPDIFMCDIKEPHFFAKDLIRQSDKFHGKKKWLVTRTMSEYRNIFSKADDENYLGEASVTYLYSKEAAQRIRKFNPDAKIIMIFRNPVDFLYSLHSQQLATCTEDIQDFDEALKAEKRRKQGEDIPRHVQWPSLLFYSEWTNYEKQAKRFFDLFPKNQILLLLFEEFKKDNPGTVKRVFKFLDVDDSFEPRFARVNVNKTVRIAGFNAVERLYWLHKFSRKILPRFLLSFLVSVYRKLFFKKTKRVPLNQDFRKSLEKKLSSEVRKFEKFIGHPLKRLWF